MRIYAILAAIILALSLGLWYSLSKLITARSELTSTMVALDGEKARNEALQGVIGGIQTGAQKAAESASQTQREIKHALQENPDWASTAVPAAVRAGLCKQSGTRCAQASSVQSSSNPSSN